MSGRASTRGSRAPGRAARLAGTLLALLAAGCDEGNDPRGLVHGGAPHRGSPCGPCGPWFEEVALERGLDFVHDSGHRGRHLFPETVSGGAALFDMDGDGHLDCYLVQSGDLLSPPERRPPNRLFRNRGDGHFEDVTEGSGADDRGYGMGVATGDFDGDGRVDLFVTNLGPDVLLRNLGGGRFDDVSRTAGVDEPAWSSSAVFLDYDLDGDLDLFVVRYIRWTPAEELDCTFPPYGPDYCSPKSYEAPAPDALYRNGGDGTFTDVSAELGLRTAFGNGLGVVYADFEGDGRPEIFVANDGSLNQLWRWRPPGRFVDEALRAGVAMDQDGIVKAGMGVLASDFDDDGDEDLLVVNLRAESDSYYRNDGDFFSDRTALIGLGAVSRPFTRFGVVLADFDNDGWPDLYYGNGRVTRAPEPLAADPYAEPNMLLRGLPGGRFEEALPRGGTAELLIATSRAVVLGDLDGDGGLDLLVVNRDGPAHLLLNRVAARGGFVRLRVVDGEGRDALGAVLTARLGDRRLTRVVRSGYGYCAAHDPTVHVGLGAAEWLEDVRVRWPDGTTRDFGRLPAGESRRLAPGDPEEL